MAEIKIIIPLKNFKLTLSLLAVPYGTARRAVIIPLSIKNPWTKHVSYFKEIFFLGEKGLMQLYNQLNLMYETDSVCQVQKYKSNTNSVW